MEAGQVGAHRPGPGQGHLGLGKASPCPWLSRENREDGASVSSRTPDTGLILPLF